MKLSKMEIKKYSNLMNYRSDLKFFEDNVRKLRIYNERGERISHKKFIELESKDVFVRDAFKILNFIHGELLLRPKTVHKLISKMLLERIGKTGRYLYKISKGRFKK